jgi:hypothetical protein
MPARLFATVLFMLLLAAGCAPPAALPTPTDMTPAPSAATPSPTPADAIVGQPPAPTDAALQLAGAAAVQVAASTLGLGQAEITVTAIEEMEWPDASLGCPQPGYAYAQVITPGYRATVQAGGQSYDVHMDSQGYGLICPPP